MPMDDLDRQAMECGDEELIPADVSDTDLYDEMNARSCKAGLTNRHGESVRGTGKIMTTVSFGETRLNLWPRNEQGELID